MTTERRQVSRVLNLLPWTDPAVHSARHGPETAATVAMLDSSLDNSGGLWVVSAATIVGSLFVASGEPHSTSLSVDGVTGSETPELQ